MGIEVECPHGHSFKVKDKYAGKKGLCPYCKGKEVFVRVPKLDSTVTIEEAAARAVREERGGRPPSLSDSSIFDDMEDKGTASTSASGSGSLLGSSVVRHNIRCRCGESVPMWFAKCPNCGDFIEHM